MGYYDTAQICLNGHVINANVNEFPAHNATHCSKCGEPTITQCPSCNTEIRGSHEAEGVAGLGREFQAPAYCHKCGKIYPWTEKRLLAAKQLADGYDELSSDDKEKLKGTFDDLFRENAMTEIAGFRFKTIMTKVRKESYEEMKNIFTDITIQAIRKFLFGPS